VAKQCSTCEGLGDVPCSSCGGRSYHQRDMTRTRWDNSIEHYTERIPCSSCSTGRLVCPACNGSGSIDQPRPVPSPAITSQSQVPGPLSTRALGEEFVISRGDYEYHPRHTAFHIQLGLDGSTIYLTRTPGGGKHFLEMHKLPMGQWFTPKEPDGSDIPVELRYDGAQLRVRWK
jgi:hypothetical protein